MSRADRHAVLGGLAAYGVVALLVAVLPHNDPGSPPTPFIMTIDVSVTAPSARLKTSDADPCITAEGYGDIAAGTPMAVTDDTGVLLATAALGQAFWVRDNLCGFDFSVTLPQGKTSYRFVTEHHGSIQWSAADLKNMHNKVGLEIQ